MNKDEESEFFTKWSELNIVRKVGLIICLITIISIFLQAAFSI